MALLINWGSWSIFLWDECECDQGLDTKAARRRRSVAAVASEVLKKQNNKTAKPTGHEMGGFPLTSLSCLQPVCLWMSPGLKSFDRNSAPTGESPSFPWAEMPLSQAHLCLLEAHRTHLKPLLCGRSSFSWWLALVKHWLIDRVVSHTSSIALWHKHSYPNSPLTLLSHLHLSSNRSHSTFKCLNTLLSWQLPLDSFSAHLPLFYFFPFLFFAFVLKV